MNIKYICLSIALLFFIVVTICYIFTYFFNKKKVRLQISFFDIIKIILMLGGCLISILYGFANNDEYHVDYKEIKDIEDENNLLDKDNKKYFEANNYWYCYDEKKGITYYEDKEWCKEVYAAYLSTSPIVDFEGNTASLKKVYLTYEPLKANNGEIVKLLGKNECIMEFDNNNLQIATEYLYAIYTIVE